MPDLLAKKDIQLTTSRIPLERGSLALFYIGLVIFFVTASSIGGLFLLNRNQKTAREALIAEVDQKQANLNTDTLNQIFLLDQRLKNMRQLIGQHVFMSNVLQFLEINTLATIRFSSFNFDIVSRKLDMTAEATSYAALSRQINVFERDPNVEEVEFGGLSVGANNSVGFKVSIIFKNSFLKLKL